LRSKPAFVEVEVDSPDQLVEVLSVVGVDVVLLDNFSLDQVREAVRLRDSNGLRGKVALEVSGGVTLETIGTLAAAGVERISVGALTHSAPALDFSLEACLSRPI
jgi:nicotinate-nucleotide pyrophosphorylase (carboxylating)